MMSHLLAVLAIATTACGLVAPPRTPRTALVASPPTSRTSTALAAVAELAAAQVFGRLADKKLLLDVPGAGTPEMRDCDFAALIFRTRVVATPRPRRGCFVETVAATPRLRR